MHVRQVVTEHKLEDQIAVTMSNHGLPCLQGVKLAHRHNIFFQIRHQLCARFLVIVQITSGILGVPQRYLAEFAKHPHIRTCLITRKILRSRGTFRQGFGVTRHTCRKGWGCKKSTISLLRSTSSPSVTKRGDFAGRSDFFNLIRRMA